MALTEKQERAWIVRLEEIGETRVRSELDHGKISSAFIHLTSKWLSERERAAEHRKEASISEQIELMRRASAAAERQAIAAERANRRATIALVIAIAAMIVTIIGIGITHWDVH